MQCHLASIQSSKRDALAACRSFYWASVLLFTAKSCPCQVTGSCVEQEWDRFYFTKLEKRRIGCMSILFIGHPFYFTLQRCCLCRVIGSWCRNTYLNSIRTHSTQCPSFSNYQRVRKEAHGLASRSFYRAYRFCFATARWCCLWCVRAGEAVSAPPKVRFCRSACPEWNLLLGGSPGWVQGYSQ